MGGEAASALVTSRLAWSIIVLFTRPTNCTELFIGTASDAATATAELLITVAFAAIFPSKVRANSVVVEREDPVCPETSAPSVPTLTPTCALDVSVCCDISPLGARDAAVSATVAA